MKTTIIIATALLAVVTTATAKSWRINNNTNAAADFASINAAMSSTDVLAGDTLYLDPGTSLSGDQTVTKQVTIVGPGYFRTDPPHAFAYLQGELKIWAPYTKVEGIIMLNSSNIYIYASYVTIERCKFYQISFSNYDGVFAQYATIRQCYGSYIRGRGNTSDRSAYCTVANCILIGEYGIFDNLFIPSIHHNYLKCTSGNYVLNNIDNATITDNILINSSAVNKIFNNISNSVNVANNVISGENAYFPANSYGNTEATVFKLEGLNDQLYQLKDDSPAKGYATDGGDCGPFGGLYPYVLGGLPNGYPYYTKAIIAPKSVNGKVNVSLNIKMQNE